MNMNLFHRRVALTAKVFGLLLPYLFFACDSLKDDALPDGEEIKIEGSQRYTLPNTSAYIDLHSLVKTQEQIQFKIVSQPLRGNLTEMDGGILQYAPHVNFTKGKDSFGFSILTLDNKLLRQDSVVIIVSSDSTSLPCGLYAVTDSVRNYTSGEVTIDVLKNDLLCDTAHVKLQVYKPAANAVPLYGSAVVVNNKINYTSNVSFSGADYIFYKVSSTLDSSQFTFGKVSISAKPVQPPASADSAFFVYDDYYNYTRDSVNTPDTLHVFVFTNDHLPGTGYISSITSFPKRGTATLTQLISIDYRPDASSTIKKDTLRYQVCRGGQCKTATVFINRR